MSNECHHHCLFLLFFLLTLVWWTRAVYLRSSEDPLSELNAQDSGSGIPRKILYIIIIILVTIEMGEPKLPLTLKTELLTELILQDRGDYNLSCNMHTR